MFFTICILTYNSEKTLDSLLAQISKLDGISVVIIDSGSTDRTIEIINERKNNIFIKLFSHDYECHSKQISFAVSLSKTDWVLCLDSDEIPTNQFINAIANIEESQDIHLAGRMKREWHVLGRKVHAMYPCSCPDYIIRFFNRKVSRFNDSVVDDKVIGFEREFMIDGHVDHHTFETKEQMDAKLKSYTERLTTDSNKGRSKLRGVLSAFSAFIKWYFRKKAFLDGSVGIDTAKYAAKYSYIKYAK